MASVTAQSVVRQIESLYDGGSVAGMTDRQLVERFVARRDAGGENAFAALVARHGPMVLGVCQKLLGDWQQAEDAFQAVFLVLAGRARSIRDPDLLGNWLYGIALRTARKARARQARQRKYEEDRAVKYPDRSTTYTADQAAIAREEAESLHAEVERLPRVFRVPVVLCYFEGLTLDQAATRLCCPAGTIRSRLVRARDRLRRGLTRRGVILPSAILAAALSTRASRAAVSANLCETTTRAAISFAAGKSAVPPLAAGLAREVLRSMVAGKLRFTVLMVFLFGGVATGAGYVNQLLATEQARKESAMPATSTIVARTDPPLVMPDPATAERMTVIGRVLDASGTPAAGVPLDLIAVPRRPPAGTDVRKEAFISLDSSTADADGRFRIEAARSSSARSLDLYVLAGPAGPGSGFGCLRVHPDAEQAVIEMHLRREHIIRGRLLDVNGQPAAGVEVCFSHVVSVSPAEGGGDFDSIYFGFGHAWSLPPQGLHAWPKPVKSDGDGRFAISGVGRGLSAGLFIEDPRFAQQRITFEVEERDAAKEVALTLYPATTIEGRALAADTGRPIEGAVVSVRASFGAFGAMFTSKFQADGQGRFKISPYSGDYFRMRVFPPDGQPYLAREHEFAWTKGAVKKELDLTLPRGVLIHGKVTEDGTGVPVAGASVQYVPVKPPADIIYGYEAIVLSKHDGSFELAVPAGKGHLMVMAPTLDYIPKEISGGQLYASGQPGGWRFYSHDIIAYEFKPGESSQTIAAVLKRGKTLRGRASGPSGAAVNDVVILTRQQIDPINLTWLTHHYIHTRDGRFELHGLDPENTSPAYFLDANHGCGAAVVISGKQAGAELSVQLEPCGQAKARFVGPDGKPIDKLEMGSYMRLLMTPGPSPKGSVDRGSELTADETYLANVDPKHYDRSHGPVTDAEGRITLPDLIPGAPYRIIDWSTVNDVNRADPIRKDFTVKPGETLELGDILIEKPPRR